jgi:hypothetical protein
MQKISADLLVKTEPHLICDLFYVGAFAYFANWLVKWTLGILQNCKGQLKDFKNATRKRTPKLHM